MNIVILAAGSGKRMLSDQPKALHLLAGKPLIQHVIETACKLNPTNLVVVINQAISSIGINQTIQPYIPIPIHVVIQHEQLGTGHALKQALPKLTHSIPTLVLYADVPLIKLTVLEQLIKKEQKLTGSLGILTISLQDPTGYGRIIKNDAGMPCRIVEENNASDEEKKICEVYTGIMIAPTYQLSQWLQHIGNNNFQNECLLTDIIALAFNDKINIFSVKATNNDQVLGVNNRTQLANLERQYQYSIAQKILQNGTTLADPARFDLRGTLSIGKDVFIDINTLIEGSVIIGDHVTIGPNCILKNCTIGNNSLIDAFSLIDSATIGNNSIIGPYARIRPGSTIADNVKIGNFVEIKNTKVKQQTKINHLSYIGDAIIGENVNIGAGTITCNFDGIKKNQTIINDNVFVGSDCQLIAPLYIGKNKNIAAGTTVWKNIPNDQNELILNEKIQKNITKRKNN